MRGNGVWGRIGVIKNLEQYGWWGNRGVFCSLGSWVKYGGNMEGVRKCRGRSAKMWGEV